MTDGHVEQVAEFAVIIQVGTRSMYNAALLSAVSRCGCAVLLKRGITAPVEDLLQAAEFLAATGNPNEILCERGIRTSGRLTRNTRSCIRGGAEPDYATAGNRLSEPCHGAALADCTCVARWSLLGWMN